jgi:hypothetical protein
VRIHPQQRLRTCADRQHGVAYKTAPYRRIVVDRGEAGANPAAAAASAWASHQPSCCASAKLGPAAQEGAQWIIAADGFIRRRAQADR